MHLTLVFIGEVDETLGARITRTMNAPIAFPPFRLTFGGVGAFPARGRPRALFIGIVEGTEHAAALQARVASSLEAVGIPQEPRQFQPHLTIARWRESRPADRQRATDERLGTVATVDVREVALYQSRLSSNGPTYTRLAGAALT